MAKLDAFRKLIREEVRSVLREELKSFMTEIKKPAPKTNYTGTLKESFIKEAPKVKQKQSVVYSDDPLQQLLAETARGMDSEEYKTLISAGSDIAQGFPQMFEQEGSFAPTRSSNTIQPQVVETVSEMLASVRPTSDINQVNIDVVPDFTELMQTMKAKGSI